MSLRINTTEHKEPDTRLTKNEIDDLVDEIDDADRAKMTPILKKVLDNQINEYHKTEMNGFLKMLENEKFKLREIKSASKGLLMKLVPSHKQKGGMPPAAPKFHYRSVQVHSFASNGKRMTRKNIVTVNGKRGTKTVHTFDSTKPKKTRKNTKKLTRKEISNIHKGVFMPGLFRVLN
jgi:hypothetical protein